MRASEWHASLVIGWALEQQALSGPLFRGEHHHQDTETTKQRKKKTGVFLLGALSAFVVIFSARTHETRQRAWTPDPDSCFLSDRSEPQRHRPFPTLRIERSHLSQAAT
jgi:hypothetical protein